MTEIHRRTAVGVFVVWALALGASPLAAQVSPKYLYTLSSVLGPFRYDAARVAVDQDRDEAYLVYQNVVRIFNASGMEVFSFGDDLGLGQIVDAAADPNGDIILLSYKDSRHVVTRCNFRGVPVGPIEVTNLPAGVKFRANRMVVRGGLFYFADLPASTVTVTGPDGRCRQYIDFPRLIGVDEIRRAGAEMFGFAVDRDGGICFTMPTMFKVYKFSPDGTLKDFGRPGSSPGRFGIISGIATDSRGDLLVSDKLRSVVMVFDKDFNFVTEFGNRGSRPENLIGPDNLAVDRTDRVYVSQARRRGVSVFALAGQ
jgi:DNA-binding beta-propeller fold protein YncE